MKIAFKKLSKENYSPNMRTAVSDFADFIHIEGSEAKFTFGLVKTSHGQRPCAIENGVPQYFWDADDGWNEVPTAEYVEVK